MGRRNSPRRSSNMDKNLRDLDAEVRSGEDRRRGGRGNRGGRSRRDDDRDDHRRDDDDDRRRRRDSSRDRGGDRHRRHSSRDRGDLHHRKERDSKCDECGGRHETSRCPYGELVAQEWHSFFDQKTKRPYFFNTQTGKKTWTDPSDKKNQTVLWCCDACNVLLPSAIGECVMCHAVKPVREEK